MSAASKQGAHVWYVPDGYLPAQSAAGSELVSHEAVCLLNVTNQEAHVDLTFYFEDRAPIRDVKLTLGGERAWHVRLDQPEQLGGVVLPKDTPYALRVESDVPIIVQHSRMDVRDPNMALFTTMAWPSA
jgi:hypothetical protein